MKACDTCAKPHEVKQEAAPAQSHSDVKAVAMKVGAVSHRIWIGSGEDFIPNS